MSSKRGYVAVSATSLNQSFDVDSSLCVDRSFREDTYIKSADNVANTTKETHTSMPRRMMRHKTLILMVVLYLLGATSCHLREPR